MNTHPRRHGFRAAVSLPATVLPAARECATASVAAAAVRTTLLVVLMFAGHAAIAQSPAMTRPASPVSGVAGLTQSPVSSAPAPANASPSAVPVISSASAEDIRDIRGPKAIASAWLIPLIVLTTLAAGGGAYASWVWNRRRLREASIGPYDTALERLERARSLMQRLQGREFSIEVSSAVREYIESRFRIRAAHLTTHEFLRDLLDPRHSATAHAASAPGAPPRSSLTESPPSPDATRRSSRAAHPVPIQPASLATHRALLEDFLNTCDLAKFGGWNLVLDDMETMLQSARRFIIESAEIAEPAQPLTATAARAPATAASAPAPTAPASAIAASAPAPTAPAPAIAASAPAPTAPASAIAASAPAATAAVLTLPDLGQAPRPTSHATEPPIAATRETYA